MWHGADSRNCSWSSNVVRANTVTVSAEPSSNEPHACKREGATTAQQSVFQEAPNTPRKTTSTELPLGEDAKAFPISV